MYLIFKSLWSNANFMPLFKKKFISYQFYIKVYFFISLINGWLKERSDNNKVTDLFLLKSNVYASRKNYGVLINNSLLFLHYDYHDLKLMHKLIWDNQKLWKRMIPLRLITSFNKAPFAFHYFLWFVTRFYQSYKMLIVHKN